MSAILYNNPQGRPVFSHSYSAGLDWSCPRKYEIKRIKGYISREESVALRFGDCIEGAVRWHLMRNYEPKTCVEEFQVLWSKFRDNEDITYSEKSGDWEDHYRIGQELCRLFELNAKAFPLANPRFQINLRREFFPGDAEFAGLEFNAYVDVVSTVERDHPMLPPLEGEGPRDVVIDIKTSAAPYFSDPRLARLDGQLRKYAWVSGIPTVAFLVFVKNKSGIERGDWVTLFHNNKKVIVLDINDDDVIVLEHPQIYQEYRQALEQIKGKGAMEAKRTLLEEFKTKGFLYPRSEVTKQRIQFLPAVIPQQDSDAAGEQAANEAVEIARCNIEGFFPQKPGVRFPSSQCLNCECLGFCLDDQELVKERLIQIGGEF
jgi:hypothetical protein